MLQLHRIGSGITYISQYISQSYLYRCIPRQVYLLVVYIVYPWVLSFLYQLQLPPAPVFHQAKARSVYIEGFIQILIVQVLGSYSGILYIRHFAGASRQYHISAVCLGLIKGIGMEIYSCLAYPVCLGKHSLYLPCQVGPGISLQQSQVYLLRLPRGQFQAA
ncbi:MAG: hypothetical protein BWY95_01209 [Bacteroidetes bacterium ADurb.BinA104]|nr:MAG: hypothetical protein BWY95_01209 [Bacteroidetes bacterium ADurb.BinA104]